MAETLDEPEAVVVIDELADGNPCFFDRFEAMEIKNLFLQRSIEPLDDAVAFGTPHEGR